MAQGAGLRKIGFANVGAGLRPISGSMTVAAGLAPNGQAIDRNGQNGRFLGLDGEWVRKMVSLVPQGFTACPMSLKDYGRLLKKWAVRELGVTCRPTSWRVKKSST